MSNHEFGPEDRDAFTDYFDLVDEVIDTSCTPERIELNLAWIVMTHALLPEVDLGSWHFEP